MQHHDNMANGKDERFEQMAKIMYKFMSCM